jgi:hypothetical protein
MTLSPWGGAARAPLRVGLGLIAALDVVVCAFQLASMHVGPLSHPAAPAMLLVLAGRPLLLAPLALLGAIALSGFARKSDAVGAGFAGLGVMVVLDESYAAVAGGPSRSYFFSGALLLGWLFGLLYGRTLRLEPSSGGPDPRERLAELGAAGVLGAIYVGAGTSKLLAGGFGWEDGNAIRALILEEHPIVYDGLMGQWAAAVVDHAWIAGMLGAFTLVAQCGAVLYPFHAWTRIVCGFLMLGFHVQVALLTGIGYMEARVLVLLFSFPWPALVARLRRRRSIAPATEDPVVDPRLGRHAMKITFVTVVVLLGLAFVLPIRAYTAQHHAHRPANGPSR